MGGVCESSGKAGPTEARTLNSANLWLAGQVGYNVELITRLVFFNHSQSVLERGQSLKLLKVLWFHSHLDVKHIKLE